MEGTEGLQNAIKKMSTVWLVFNVIVINVLMLTALMYTHTSVCVCVLKLVM